MIIRAFPLRLLSLATNLPETTYLSNIWLLCSFQYLHWLRSSWKYH